MEEQMWNRSTATLFILQASVLRICAFFFSYLQRKDVSSAGKLFCPTLKERTEVSLLSPLPHLLPRLPSCFSSSHLPALAHIHSLHLQEFFCPLPGLRLKKGGVTQNTTQESVWKTSVTFHMNLHQYTMKKINLVQRKSILLCLQKCVQ